MKAVIWNSFILVCLHQTFTNAQFTGYGRQRGNRRTTSCTLPCPAGYKCIFVRTTAGTIIQQCTVNRVAQYNTNYYQKHVTHTNTGTGQLEYGSGQRSALQALRNKRLSYGSGQRSALQTLRNRRLGYGSGQMSALPALRNGRLGYGSGHRSALQALRNRRLGYASGQRSALQALRNRQRLVQRLRQSVVYSGRPLGTHHVQPTVEGGHFGEGYGSQRQVNSFRQTTNTENPFGETATNPGNTFSETVEVGGHVGSGHVENTYRNTPRLTNNIGNTYIGRIGRGLNRYRGRSHNQPTQRGPEATKPFGYETVNPDPIPTDNSPIAKGQATKIDVNLKNDVTNGQILGAIDTSTAPSGGRRHPVSPNFRGAFPLPPTLTDEWITGQTNKGTSSTCVSCTSNTDCTVTWEYCIHSDTCAQKVCQQLLP